MIDQQLSDILFKGAKSGNTIRDANNSIPYSVLHDAVINLNRYFDTLSLDQARCIHLSAQNNLSSVVIVLTLIVRKINFFLATNNNASAALTIPDFCDKVLSLKEGDPDILKLGEYIDVADNSTSNIEESQTAIQPNAGAVLLSSSGTTGTPKFIYYRSIHLIGNAEKCIERFRITAEHHVLVPVPITHMFGLGVGLLPALVSGASICLIEKNNIVRLMDKLLRFKPDFTLVTPTVCKMLLILNKPLQNGGSFISAGDKLKKEVQEEFESKYGKLINLYGCSEMGAIATSEVEGNLRDRTIENIRPLTNVTIEIDGEKGEILCVHDAGFDFYTDRFGRKMEDFPKEKSAYRTRDLGQWKENGSFTVIGRTDNCTNRSGFLVSLREVELALEEIFSEVNQALVFENNTETIRGASLVAVCELKNISIEPNEHVFRAICAEKMPKHWVPDQFYFVSELPKLSNGKPDRISVIKNYRALEINSET